MKNDSLIQKLYAAKDNTKQLGHMGVFDGSIDLWNTAIDQAISIVQAHERNCPSEISVVERVANAVKACLTITKYESGKEPVVTFTPPFSDCMHIAEAAINAMPMPVSVSLMQCSRAVRDYMQANEECRTDEIAKAVLDAAGVCYE